MDPTVYSILKLCTGVGIDLFLVRLLNRNLLTSYCNL